MDCRFLEIDVNGEGVFVVDKGVLTSYSGKLCRLLHKAKPTSNLKVVFHDLPGGADGFELMTRFCYQNGRFPVTPSNICLLLSIGHFMEMTKDVCPYNLIEQTEQFMQSMAYWSWLEVVTVLKECQQLYPSAASSDLLAKCLHSSVQRIGSPSDGGSLLSASPDSGSFRLSCDTKSSESTRTGSHRCYWYEELVVFRPEIIGMLGRVMISHKLDHLLISRFLFYYFKSKIPSTVKPDERAKIVETVIELVFLLDQSSIGCKSLFEVLRVASSLNVSKCSKEKLEKMIGLRLDQATLDNLLIPAPIGLGYFYDVDIVLRFLKTFVSQASTTGLKKVVIVVDKYISEVAPDPCLKPAKFIDLAKAVPDSSRGSDQMYCALDMYLQVHSELSEVDKIELCCVFNCEKLSKEAYKLLTNNPRFCLSRMQDRAEPPEAGRQIGPNNMEKKYNGQGHSGRKPKHEAMININKDVLCAKSLQILSQKDNDAADDDLVHHVEKMQMRVKELEKTCRKMQAQMSKMKKPRFYHGRRSLPRLCS